MRMTVTKGPRRAVRKSPAARRIYGGVDGAQRMQERRERLLDTALELFALQGYQNTPIEQLCAQARVTTRYFYEAFAGREALLLALYERLIRETQAAIARVLQQPGLDPQTRLAAGIRAFFETYVRDRRRAQIGVLEVVGVSPAVEKRRREVIREFAGVLQGYADALVKQKRLPPRDYHPLSLALVGGINELLAEWLMTGNKDGLQELQDVVLELLQALMLGGAVLARGAPPARRS
jgi:AcrR family transcriptional regulator